MYYQKYLKYKQKYLLFKELACKTNRYTCPNNYVSKYLLQEYENIHNKQEQ